MTVHDKANTLNDEKPKTKNKLVKPSKFDVAQIMGKMLWHEGKPFAKSTDIARYFGMNHKNMLRKIESFYSFDAMLSGSKLRHLERKVRGGIQRYYEMDAEAFSFICLSMTGKKAEKFKWAFIEAFKMANKEALINQVRVEINREIEQFVVEREEGKKVRLDFTNTMQRLCKYAEEIRGMSYGGKCPFYPMYTRLIYKSLGLCTVKAGGYKIRDLSIEDVQKVKERESEVSAAVNEMIDNGEDYHDIYKWIKENIEVLWL